MSPRTATLAALVLAGCFTDAGDGSGSTSATGEGTSSGSAAATSDPGTSAGESTSSSSSSSGEVATSSTDAGDGDSSTGSPPVVGACWGSNADWDTTVLDLEALAGELPAAPTLAPDGLAIHYLAGPLGERVPYRAGRDSRQMPFVGGAPLAGWNTEPTALAQLRIAEEGDHLVARVGSNLEVSFASASSWQTLSAVAFGAGFDELTDPAIDALGRVLLFGRREELRDGNGTTLIWALFRAAWPAGAPAPSDPERLELPGFGLEHAQLCPALSPDGEHLFLGGSFPETWDTSVVGDLDVFESVSEVGAWSSPTRVESLSSAERHACPVSVTEDGCELIVRYFDVPFTGNTFMLARRPAPAGP